MSEDDTTPNEDLRELLTDMRNVAQQAGSAGDYECANVIESFAEDLEEVIEG